MQPLLMWNALVVGHERIILLRSPSKKIAVADAFPTTILDCFCFKTLLEEPVQSDVEMFIDENTHRHA